MILMSRRVEWRGFMPAAVTPFDREGNLNENALRQMLRLLIEDGVSGIVLLGDNGESWMLTDDEKERVFQIGVEECKGKVTIIGTTSGDYDERRVMKLTEYAKSIGMDGVMLHAPHREITESEMLAYYKRVSRLGIPIMIYNIPRKLPVNIETGLMRKLADQIDNFVAVKESDRDFWVLSDKIKLMGDELAFFVGPCSLILPGLQLGAAGYIATSPEFLGRRCEDIIRFIRNHDLENAVKLHYVLCDSYRMLSDASLGTWAAKLKCALELLGKPAGFPRRPIEPLTEEQKQGLQRRMAQIGLIPVGNAPVHE
jgi:4-hydroxy-tetrahydrodipicolinate synthase